MSKFNDNAVRSQFLTKFLEFARNELGEDAYQFESGAFGFPVVDDAGIEGHVCVYIKIPRGTREGEAFDIYEASENYKVETAAKAEKKAIAEARKVAKIKADEKARKDKATKKTAQ